MSEARRGRKVAVVLFNLGGPDSLEAVRPFLFNLFKDPAIVGLPAIARLPLAALISFTRNKEASANYAHMGGSTPLLRETEAQARALEAALEAGDTAGDEVRAFIAMRYWAPFTEATAREVAAWGPDEIVLLPLYPQYSTTTTGSSLAAWTRAYSGPGRTRTVCCWPTLDGLVQAHADHLVEVWEAAGRPDGLRLLFSAHGLPERVIEAGDPYQWQVERTCAAVVDRVRGRLGGDSGVVDWRVCYQSRVGPLKWIGPSTPEAIETATGEGMGVMVTPIAFVSEHVETLVELDRDYSELAESLGAEHYLRVPALGVAEKFIEGLADVVRRALRREAEVESDGAVRICPAEFGRCPARLAQAPAQARA
ncbi:MAG: ferrochelatase [Caulobacteraceae bacterium]|nr:ferrochelatase [Caulobacter sp.]